MSREAAKGAKEKALYPETTIESAALFAERTRAEVEAATFDCDEEPLQITISLGATALEPSDTLETLVAHADANQYKAKENGRNRGSVPSCSESPELVSAMSLSTSQPVWPQCRLRRRLPENADVSIDQSVTYCPSTRRLGWTPLVILLVSMAVGCGDRYEPKATVDGVFQPTVNAPDGSHCVQIVGHRANWLSYPTVEPTICQPIRISEIGVMTLEPAWVTPEEKLEVARLEFDDGSAFFSTAHLRDVGRFEYSERSLTLNDWLRHNHFTITGLAFIGFVVAVSISLRAYAKTLRRRRERDQTKAAAAAKASAQAAAASARAVARAAALGKLSRFAADAQRATDSLPIILGEAEITLDRAQAELGSLLPSPFWEAMEDALGNLRAFLHALSIIDSRRTEYRTQSAQLESPVPAFTLGVSVLPDPAATQSRLNRLYREAQSIPHFSIVYEQRRTTAVLIAGFRSLGQAIERLGDRIVDEIGSLAASLDCRLASLESSLESSATAAAEQSAALRAQLQSAVDANDAILGQLHQDAEARSETERQALRMLDNIQHRRKPTIFDRP